jgi:uncharacterized protein YbbC (DUF1343 family)
VARQFFPLPFPVLPGLTHGELGLWLCREHPEWGADYHVAGLAGWRRADPWAATGLPWIPPSPNLPTAESVLAYACTGLLQATAVSEGRGTCQPFAYFGAPFLDAHALAEALNARRLPGLLFRPLHFQPGFNKFAGQPCGGAHLLFLEPAAVDPIRTQMAILQELARLAPAELAPTPGLGAWLDGGAWPVARLQALETDAWRHALEPALAEFRARTAPCRLYP